MTQNLEQGVAELAADAARSPARAAVQLELFPREAPEAEPVELAGAHLDEGDRAGSREVRAMDRMSTLYCSAPDCDDPTDPGHPRPVAGHGSDLCSTHRRQLTRTGTTKPIAEKLNAEERVIEAGTKMLEADEDVDYAQARRVFLAACRALAQHDRERQAMAKIATARARGSRFGHAPKVTTAQVMAKLAELGGDRFAAAAALQISPSTVSWHRRRAEAGIPLEAPMAAAPA